MVKFIHYGSSSFDPTRWLQPFNSGGWIKPHGGLWASPVGAKRSWFNWCQDAGYELQALETWFEFTLSPGARVLELTPENLFELPVQEDLLSRFKVDRETHGYMTGIDFEATAKLYDVLLCDMTKYPDLYWSLYGWDCDCILVLNKEVIVCDA